MFKVVPKVRMARKIKYVSHWLTENLPAEPTLAAAAMNWAGYSQQTPLST